MKKQYPQTLFKTIARLFIAAYLIGCFTNMMCIPRYVPDVPAVSIAPRPHRVYAIGANFSNPNFLQIFDKSTVDNDVINELTFAPKSFDLVFCFRDDRVEIPPIFSPQNHPYNNYQYSYLSFCTFRI
jgi:hypothetical protein